MIERGSGLGGAAGGRREGRAGAQSTLSGVEVFGILIAVVGT